MYHEDRTRGKKCPDLIIIITLNETDPILLEYIRSKKEFKLSTKDP